MVARIRRYCLSATLLATATVTPNILAELPSAGCAVRGASEFFFPTRDCALDRSAPAMHGPFQFTLDYSDKSKYTFDPKYINDLGPNDALSLEFAFGTKVFRAGSTWGHAITDNVFFKATAEYFAQRPDFIFISGVEPDWVGQWDAGADVRFLISNQRGLDSVHVAFQYINANGEDLPSKQLQLADTTIFTNLRAIRGGTELGGTLGARVRPWSTGYLDIDLYYDQNNYQRTYQPDEDAIGFGVGAAYHQNFGERIQLVLSGMDRRPYYEYLAGVKWIARHSQGSLLELGMQFSVNGGDVPFAKENRLGLGLYYSWGGDMYSAPVIYNDPLNRGMRQELVDYTNVPAVRSPQVLAISDETKPTEAVAP